MKFHQDNFTIPTAVLTALAALVFMGLFTQYAIRRASYELFYYAHHFSIIFFLVMLWHATMGWYYVIAGLVLWGVDHCIRLSNSIGYTVTLHDVKLVSDDITVLTYTARGSFGHPLNHVMGQYCFINIPVVSEMEWHPFTISSAPDDPVRTHHIRSMGKNEWTGKLHGIVKGVLEAPLTEYGQALAEIKVNVDGPYGLPVASSHYRHILLVGGGIGVTPLHSCLRQLYMNAAREEKDSKGAKLLSVRLIWVMKTVQESTMFTDTVRMGDVLCTGDDFPTEKYKQLHYVLSCSVLC